MAVHDKPRGGGQTTEELRRFANEYEGWAVGLMDRVPDDRPQVMNLLTRAPARRVGLETVHVWGQSVLDESTQLTYPAMEFVAHWHCQAVLTE